MLELYIITHRTADYGDKFVVRRRTIAPDGSEVPDAEPTAVCDSLAEARAACPPGLMHSARWAGDDPVIVEMWL